ncbi:alpha-D-ribose 1-methylphosphonate 5-phosphate C-P-lyase PhnJ [Pseudogemmobacter humi]|uniref:alpha-D-ribose 1-methylphosphonate 5-phosphate C-P-lyase PhnJ n=1 Tax=Pseudogemmobacter humi TaxID=2483812 RepID=UPI0013598F5B|nr:alpha-D-ribose 1-methylphosphonate 5-phosphate C-P-lyase PhnJ [Pseudogemmobacter humi]
MIAGLGPVNPQVMMGSLPIPKFDDPKLPGSLGVRLSGARRERRIHALPFRTLALRLR